MGLGGLLVGVRYIQNWSAAVNGQDCFGKLMATVIPRPHITAVEVWWWWGKGIRLINCRSPCSMCNEDEVENHLGLVLYFDPNPARKVVEVGGEMNQISLILPTRVASLRPHQKRFAR